MNGVNPQDPADPDRGRRSPTGTEDRVRDVLVVGSLTACLITLLFFVMFLVSAEMTVTYTWGLLLLPVLGGYGVTAGALFYEFAIERMNRGLVIALCALGVIVFSAGMALIFEYGNSRPIGEAPLWWMLTMAIGLGALSVVLNAVLPRRRRLSRRL